MPAGADPTYLNVNGSNYAYYSAGYRWALAPAVCFVALPGSFVLTKQSSCTDTEQRGFGASAAALVSLYSTAPARLPMTQAANLSASTVAQPAQCTNQHCWCVQVPSAHAVLPAPGAASREPVWGQLLRQHPHLRVQRLRQLLLGQLRHPRCLARSDSGQEMAQLAPAPSHLQKQPAEHARGLQ